MGLRFSAPLAANSRMENLFKSALFCRALQDYGPNSWPIQVASGGINIRAKLTGDFIFDLRVKIGKLARRLIGAKKSRCRHDFAQAIAKRGFAGGDPARDPDGRHLGPEVRDQRPEVRNPRPSSLSANFIRLLIKWMHVSESDTKENKGKENDFRSPGNNTVVNFVLLCASTKLQQLHFFF
jgi:hypothetical protein